VVDNKALEEFRERLLRWDELCSQLRELYYRYLDLAAFRSEKCFFPGRKCKRSWRREYDVSDLTLMWTYIANTSPLCGKLMKALAEVEYKIRVRTLENLKAQSGTIKRSKPNSRSEIVSIYLYRHIKAYLVLWDKLYVIWGEFDELSRNGQMRVTEMERKAVNIIERYKRGEKVEMQIDEYEIDKEYERLWFEIPLPEEMSKLFNGRDKVPIVLFRNLGWLLSDDSRQKLEHNATNFGQIAVRLFDWIAFAKYATRGLDIPLVFKLTVREVVKTREGNNPRILIRPIGVTTETIKLVYKQFGIALSKSEEVFMRGYTVLKALREEAFKREGVTYVVDNTNAWTALSSIITALVMGDGYVLPYEIGIAAKYSPRVTLEGEVILVRELAKALGGIVGKNYVALRDWYMRLLLPMPPIPVFEKTVKLYETLVNYPVAALIKIGNTPYLLTHSASKFMKEKGSCIIRGNESTRFKNGDSKKSVCDYVCATKGADKI